MLMKGNTLVYKYFIACMVSCIAIPYQAWPQNKPPARQDVDFVLLQIKGIEAKKDSVKKIADGLDSVLFQYQPQIISLRNRIDSHNVNRPDVRDIPAVAQYNADSAALTNEQVQLSNIIAPLLKQKQAAKDLFTDYQMSLATARSKLHSFKNPFASSNCGPMPPSTAPVQELQSYWGCVFEGSPVMDSPVVLQRKGLSAYPNTPSGNFKRPAVEVPPPKLSDKAPPTLTGKVKDWLKSLKDKAGH
jgi:hypothetical protein